MRACVPVCECVCVCVCVYIVNYKDKRTVEEQEGVVNTQQGGRGGANNYLNESFTRPQVCLCLFSFIIILNLL